MPERFYMRQGSPPGRACCLVPFCPRTTSGGLSTEWICRDHWKPCRLMRRKAFNRAWKSRDPARYLPLWTDLKWEAIEIAAGISK